LLPNAWRSLYPAGCFGIKFTKGLQVAILFFRQQLYTHFRSHPYSTKLGFVLFSGFKCLRVITDTPTPLRALCDTVTENVYVFFSVVTNDIRFAPCLFHVINRPELFRMCTQSVFYLIAFQIRMTIGILFKSFFQNAQQRFSLLC